MTYITFDEYYGVNEYNSFITAAKNNGVRLTEWISTRAPYNWYIGLEDSKDLPTFVDFEIATSQQEDYLVKKTGPYQPQDEYKLYRRETDSNTKFGRFVINDMWEYLSDSGSYYLFRDVPKELLLKMSKSPELEDTKIWYIGNFRTWDLWITDSKYIKGHINSTKLIKEDENSSTITKTPWEVERNINHMILRNEKIDNKRTQTAYIENGKWNPVKKTGNY
jgi:hypothetical protein